MAVVLAMLSVEPSQEGSPGAVITGKGSALHSPGVPDHGPNVAAAAAPVLVRQERKHGEEKTLRLNNNKCVIITVATMLSIRSVIREGVAGLTLQLRKFQFAHRK